jgi:hypothetical protein
MADTPLTDAEIMALKPDPQPKPAEEKPAEEKKTTYSDGTSYEDMPVKPNGTKGTVHARSKDGPPLDADGNLIKKTQKQKDEENRKKGREILDQMAKQRAEHEARLAAKAAADKARRDAIGVRDMVGVDIGLKLDLPVVGEVFNKSTTIGRPESPGQGDASIDLSVSGEKIHEKAKGVSITLRPRASVPKIMDKGGASAETTKSVDEKAKALEKAGDKISEIKAESAKIRETAAQMGMEGKSPQEINAYFTSANAELIRKYGAQAGEYAVWGPNGKPPPKE